MDQMADDVEHGPRIGPFVASHPGLGEVAEQGTGGLAGLASWVMARWSILPALDPVLLTVVDAGLSVMPPVICQNQVLLRWIPFHSRYVTVNLK